MKNVDKYLTEILAEKEPACTVHRLRTGRGCSSGDRCEDCINANKEWLEAEYVKPEVDWSKVEQGTMVYTNVHGREGECGKFVGLYKNRIVMETSEYEYRSYHKDHCSLEK